jgi:hypothetical protein
VKLMPMSRMTAPGSTGRKRNTPMAAPLKPGATVSTERVRPSPNSIWEPAMFRTFVTR